MSFFQFLSFVITSSKLFTSSINDLLCLNSPNVGIAIPNKDYNPKLTISYQPKSSPSSIVISGKSISTNRPPSLIALYY